MNHGGHFHHYHHLEHPASFGGFTANMGSGAGQCTVAKTSQCSQCATVQTVLQCHSVSCKQHSSQYSGEIEPVDIAKGERGNQVCGKFLRKCKNVKHFMRHCSRNQISRDTWITQINSDIQEMLKVVLEIYRVFFYTGPPLKC